MISLLLAATDPPLIGAAVMVILGGGGLGALVAYRKAGPEAESISVATLRGVIQEMREELERKDKIIDAQTHRMGEMSGEIASLAERVRQLEVDPPPHLS